MLKLATMDDFPDIRRMAMAFFDASPYKGLGVDANRVEELIFLFLTANPKEKLLLLWVKEKPVGVLAAAAETNLFNNHKMAGELIWWIDPEHRRGLAANKMLTAYEYWAAKVGCQFCTMVDLLGNLEKVYTKKGYERRETSYIKVL